MTTAHDRRSVGYEPRFDIDLARGVEGERLVADYLDALTAGRIEVKTDDRFLDTGNVYVEYACFFPGYGFDYSGIRTTEADAWAFVLGAACLLVPVPLLRSWVVDAIERKRGLAECRRGDHPTKGVLFGVRELATRLQSQPPR